MESNYVKNLSNVSKKDTLEIGGKAGNLGEMINSKLPVPKGYVLVADAYRIFVSYNKIDKKIEKLLIDVEENNEIIEKTSDSIKALFNQGEIPEDLITEIDKLYDNFENTKLAVRSSATLEDSIETSFAGQYDSFLNIKDKEQLYNCIKRCWSSLWNIEGLSYRLKNNISNDNLDIGVIIQEFIPGEKSGVVFTSNPINNRRDQMLINSSWGLGEAIVSGKVTPDLWVIEKKNYNILEEEIASKEFMTAQKENGVELKSVATENTKEPSLLKSELIRLLEFCRKIEEYFGYPQDIEWINYKNNFYFVQSRPITTLFPKLESDNNDKEIKIYVNFLLLDKVIHEPLTPIGVDIWKTFLTKIIPFDVKSAAGRLFVDVTEISRLERWWNRLRNNPYDMDPITTKTILEVLERERNLIRKQRKPFVTLIPTLMKFLNPSFLKFIFSSIPKAAYGKFLSPEKLVDKVHNYGEKQISLLEQKSRKLQTLEERIKFIEKESVVVYYYLPLKILYHVIDSITYLDKAKKIINENFETEFDLHKIEKSLPNNVTTEMGIRLLKIAKILDESNEKPTRNNPEIKNFLKEYGHRAYLEIDPGIPRWSEEPEYIINLIKSYIKDKSYNEKIDKFYNNKKEAEEIIEDICFSFNEKGLYKESKKLQKILNKYRKLFGIREFPKFMMVKGVKIFREVLLDIGKELKDNGRLDNKEDVFFIDIADIRSEKKLNKVALDNRKRYNEELKRKSVPRVVTSTGETFFHSKNIKNSSGNLGIPISAGVYEGQVRILESPKESYKLKNGDILVAKSTNPTWTPLFLEIGGLITEMGGPMSHGSVVAREYGIPAVSGISDATTKYKDGQLIRINGETGEVELINV